MCSEIWRLTILVSLVFYSNCEAGKCTEDGSCAEWDTVDVRSTGGDSIVDAASNIANSRSVDELIKQMEIFSRKIPAELMKDKSLRPITGKFKKNYEILLKKSKPILLMAKKLEKMGDKKSKKQLDAFAVKFKTLEKNVENFAKSSDLEKQRNRNLLIIQNQPNDGKAIENAQRFIGISDLIYKCVEWIQSIPSTLNCLIFGNCETNNEDEGEDEGEEDGEDDGGVDEEEEEGDQDGDD